MGVILNTSVEKWLAENPNTISDYHELVERVRNGERIECVTGWGDKSAVVYATHMRTGFGELLSLTDSANVAEVFSTEEEFIKFCDDNDVVFGRQPFLEKMRNRLEIAKNAANFKAIVLPLNTLQEVEQILALMGAAKS